MCVEKKMFGKTKDGRDVHTYTITNEKGAEITVMDFGAILVSVKVPDRDGALVDVVLGYEVLEAYEDNPNFFGATIGRNGNRIAGASFMINGITCEMEKNENGKNNLHSGNNGFEKQMWTVDEAQDDRVTFSLLSPDGDRGFPGNFRIRVTYTLTADNQAEIHYLGECDADTVANMTNHSYFNLNGHASGTAMNHALWLGAAAFTPVADEDSIPTGEICPVAGTPMDFTTEKIICKNIDDDYDQLKYTGGYDHNYVLDNRDGTTGLFARAKGDKTGIVMEVYTDLPGVQFYAGNFIKGPKGKDGAAYSPRDGFCLETQYYPNAVNEPAFPSPVLEKGRTYDTTTIYRFI